VLRAIYVGDQGIARALASATSRRTAIFAIDQAGASVRPTPSPIMLTIGPRTAIAAAAEVAASVFAKWSHEALAFAQRVRAGEDGGPVHH